MAAKRPVVTVFSADADGTVGQIPLPAVFASPIRTDIVQRVHKNINKNKRQPYAVANNAGEQTSAESWGTGRAVARIPRVGGGGTSRSGQGCFGNMCRGGRMFSPNKIWRKWHRMTNTNERRVAICAALAATAIPALVTARGHRIGAVHEIPLVLSNGVENCQKTKAAVEILNRHKIKADIDRVVNTKKIRPGKGKMRNRRYAQRRGPLLIYNENNGVEKAFRNIPGVDVANVNRLNLLQLAPGGHVGRFCIWTQSAFEALDSIFGTHSAKSTVKKTFTLPHSVMTNADVTRIINSDEVQSKLNAKKPQNKKVPRKLNPLRNVGALIRLNPYAQNERRTAIKASRGLTKVKPLIAKKVKKGDSKTDRRLVVQPSTRAEKRHQLKIMTRSLAGTKTQQGADFLIGYNQLRK